MNSLVEYFVSRSLFVNLLTVLLVIWGGYTAVTMNREAFPNINFDIVVVTTIYPGASAEEVELQITKQLEDTIKEVDGIKEFRSASLENRSGITIQLDPDVEDTQKVIDDIRAAVDRTEDLPEDAERPIITEVTTARTPVIEFFLARTKDKDGNYPITEKQLKEKAHILEDRLLELRGVARIDRLGWRKDEMQVNLDPDKLRAYYLSPEAVVGAIQNRNINLPGGKIEWGGKEIIVRTVGKFKSPEDVENVVVRSNDIGQVVRVKDVATVIDGLEEEQYIEKVDGLPAITLVVVKRQSSDIIDVVNEANTVREKFAKEVGEGIKVGYARDMSMFVRRRLGVLISNGVGGLILVVAALFIFLGWRTALMASLGIPIALGMSFLTMNFLGYTLNLIAMFGLIMVIGIIVDDAIIVCENVYRHIEMGKSAYQAAVDGTKEVISPVLATISTTVAAFGPMLFVTGIFGKFLSFIPATVIIALIASLFESFFILPSHLYDINKHSNVVETHEESGWFAKVRLSYYQPMLLWCLNHRLLFVGMLFGAFLVAVALQALFGSFVLFPGAVDAVHIKAVAPKGVTKEETGRYMLAIEHELSKLTLEDEKSTIPVEKQELQNYTTRVGLHQKDANDPFVRRGSHYGQVMLWLSPEQNRERKTAEIIEDLRKRLAWLLNDDALRKLRVREESVRRRKAGDKTKIDPKTLPLNRPAVPEEFHGKGLEAKLSSLEFEKLQGGPPQGKAVAIEITGDDFETLEKISDEYKTLMGNIKGVVDIGDNMEEKKDELRFHVDEKLAAQAGVSERQVALAVNIAYQGAVATSIKRADEEVDVRVRFQERFRNLQDWRKLAIQNRTGNLIPISALARGEDKKAITVINHLNGKRMLGVTANVDEGMTSQKANALIAEASKDIPAKYPRFGIRFGGENKDTEESMDSLKKAFGIGMIVIFMILSSLFRSILQPIVVVMAIPFAMIGVIFAFVIHGEPFSFLAFMGLVGLSGVVVNDSIVLVDFANRIRDENPDMPIDRIVVEATGLRLRAVFLTTLTTVAGLLPTAYGWGGYDPFLVPMAISFAWGLFFATVLTLIFVPIMYKSVHNLKYVQTPRFAAFVNRKFRGKAYAGLHGEEDATLHLQHVPTEEPDYPRDH